MRALFRRSFYFLIAFSLVACFDSGSESPTTKNIVEQANGSQVLPFNLSNTASYTGTLAANETLHFKFVKSSTTIEYKIDLSALEYNADFAVYRNSDFSTGFLCQGVYPGNLDETCSTTTSTGSLYIKVVDVSGNGGAFSLHITSLAPVGPISYISEGTVGAPIDITSLMPYDAQVVSNSIGDFSYYKITGLTPSTQYYVYLKNQVNSFAGNIYSDSAFSVSAGSSFAILGHGTIGTSSGTGELYLSFDATTPSGAGFTIGLLPAPVDEGLSGTPSSVSSLPYSGQVSGTGTSYYQITGLTPLTNYIVTVDGLYNAASLVVSPLTDAYTSDCLSNNNAIEAEVCTGRSDSTGTLNVSVSGYYSGTPFQLNVIINNSSPNNQGNPTSPISLATVPLASEVGPKGNSYYHKAGLDPAKWYIVSMTGLSSNINLDVYSDTGFSVGLCSSSKLLIEDEACVTQPSGSGDLYVQADGLNSSVGSTYSINVVETTVPPDETVSDAFANWAFPYAGSVGPGGVTEYTISGLGTTEAYSVTVSGITDIVTIEVEEEFVSKCDVFGSKIVDFACEFPVTTGTIVIRVTDMSSWGANFNLTVVSTGTAPVNQGTSMTPLDISSGLSGTVARDGTSYFVITGLTANHLYNVAFTETKGSASYRLYDASGFVSSVCYSSYTYTDRSCEGSTNASGELYIKVLDYSGAMGSTFDFVLTPTIPAPVNEGTAAAPIDVTGALPRASEVGASGDSFYVITGLSPGASVVLSSRNAYDDVVYLAVYNDSGFSSNLCTSYGTSVQGAQFCDFTVPVGGTVYVQASDPTGYQIDLILGSTFTLGFE